MTSQESKLPSSQPSEPMLSRRRLKSWIRLLRLTRSTENHLREFLRVNFDTTLPRFDVAAALYRSNKPMKMSELSQQLLVSNGNATVVVDRLEKDGLASRLRDGDDKRVVMVTLSDAGKRWFETVAQAHEAEINRLLGKFDNHQLDQIRDLLKQMERLDDE